MEYYERALSQQLTFLNDTNNKALILYKQQRYDESIEYYKIISRNANDIYAIYNKTTILTTLERYDKTLEYYDKVLTIEPSHIGGLYGKASIFFSKNILKFYSIMTKY